MAKLQAAQICLNGHTITSMIDRHRRTTADFCGKCGAQTIEKCPHCEQPIRGIYTLEGKPLSKSYSPPAYCHNCGKPYPWTESALEAMKEIIREDEDLFDDEKERMSQSLPDLLSETPRTDLAIMRVKKFALRATKEVGSALLSFVIEHGCEKVVTALGALTP